MNRADAAAKVRRRQTETRSRRRQTGRPWPACQHRDDCAAAGNRQVPEAHQEYLAASDWALAGGGSDLYISRRFASKGRLGEALEAGVRATRSAEDRQNAFYNLAALHAASGDAAAVETDLKAAILCSPHWYKAHWTLAELYERQRRFEDAARESELAFELAGGKHAEVAGTRDRILAKRNP